MRGGRQQIVITEIPFEVVKANLVKKMDEIRFDKKVDGITEVRDDTDRTGLRIVVELKKDADPNAILHYLFKNTDLQTTFHFNMVAIYHKAPQLMGLQALIQAYIDHQKSVIKRRSEYELRKAKAREHIVEGLIKAVSILDEVIKVIRASQDKRDAKNNLIDSFSFTEEQAEAIVNLQLYRLTNTDVTTLQKEAEELKKRIEELEAILSSEKKLIQVIKKNLKRVQKEFGEDRRTQITAQIEELKINMDVLIAAEDVRVTVTDSGYVKRTSLRSFSASSKEPPGMKEGDRVLFNQELNTTDTLLLFTKQGNYLFIPVHQLPDIRWKDNGQHVANLVTLDRDDEFLCAMGVREFAEEDSLLFLTKDGMVKRSQLSLYQAARHSKALVALKVKDGDQLIAVMRTKGTSEILLATNQGYGLWFGEEEVGLVGQRAAGVKAINLKDDDFVVGAETFSLDEKVEFILATQRGSVKKMAITEMEKSSRAKRGLVMLRELKSNPHRLVGCKRILAPTDEFLLRTEKGTETTIQAKSYRPSDRYSNGSYAVDTQKEGSLIEMKRIHKDVIDDKE